MRNPLHVYKGERRWNQKLGIISMSCTILPVGNSSPLGGEKGNQYIIITFPSNIVFRIYQDHIWTKKKNN